VQTRAQRADVTLKPPPSLTGKLVVPLCPTTLRLCREVSGDRFGRIRVRGDFCFFLHYWQEKRELAVSVLPSGARVFLFHARAPPPSFLHEGGKSRSKAVDARWSCRGARSCS